MNFIAGLQAANSLLRNAGGLVREMRRPQLNDQDFAQLLRDRMALNARQNTPEAQSARRADEAARLAAQAMQQRDGNMDARLTLEESGFERERFVKLDADGDGVLNVAELKQAWLNAPEQ